MHISVTSSVNALLWFDLMSPAKLKTLSESVEQDRTTKTNFATIAR